MPPIEEIHVSELAGSGLPDRLPKNSRLKVWVRSTGYEVRFFQKKIFSNPLAWAGGLLVAFALSAYVITAYASQAPYHLAILLLPLTIAILLVVRMFIDRRSSVRLDISPMTIAISYLDGANRTESQEHVPLKEIESFYVDPRRGLGLNSSISEIMYRTWIGSGLQREDLEYLARLIVESAGLSMQSPHPGST